VSYHRPVVRGRAARWVVAGTLTAVSDGLFATVQSLINGSPVSRLWQGVASVLLGKSALDGGSRTVLIGLAMHVTVAFFWSGVFLLLVERSAWLRGVLASRGGVFKVAAVYGPGIWLVMSLIVIPLLAHRPPKITPRWWVQFFGHVVFVGLPIVGSITPRGNPRSPSPAG